MNLLDLLKEFRHGKSHIAFITENIEGLQNKLGLNRRNSVLHPALINEELLKQFYSGSTSTKTSGPKEPKEDIKVLGIITLEDVIEEMINIQILDEDDYEDQKKTSSSNTNNRRKTVKANLKSSSK